jgi:hypothetical protein
MCVPRAFGQGEFGKLGIVMHIFIMVVEDFILERFCTAKNGQDYYHKNNGQFPAHFV